MDKANELNEVEDIYKAQEFRHDQEIAKNLNENTRYLLVERPKSLLSFQNNDIEKNFQIQ